MADDPKAPNKTTTVPPENNKVDGTQTMSGAVSTEKTASPVLVSPPNPDGVNKLQRAREMMGVQNEANKAHEDAAVDARQQADEQARNSPMTTLQGEEMRIAIATDELPRTFHEGTTYVDQDGLISPRNPNPMHNKNDWQPSDPPADTQPMIAQPVPVQRTQAFLYDPPAPLPEAPIGHPREVIIRDRPRAGVQTTKVG